VRFGTRARPKENIKWILRWKRTRGGRLSAVGHRENVEAQPGGVGELPARFPRSRSREPSATNPSRTSRRKSRKRKARTRERRSI
jgi:hypothetical protein